MQIYCCISIYIFGYHKKHKYTIMIEIFTKVFYMWLLYIVCFFIYLIYINSQSGFLKMNKSYSKNIKRYFINEVFYYNPNL